MSARQQEYELGDPRAEAPLGSGVLLGSGAPLGRSTFWPNSIVIGDHGSSTSDGGSGPTIEPVAASSETTPGGQPPTVTEPLSEADRARLEYRTWIEKVRMRDARTLNQRVSRHVRADTIKSGDSANILGTAFVKSTEAIQPFHDVACEASIAAMIDSQPVPRIRAAIELVVHLYRLGLVSSALRLKEEMALKETNSGKMGKVGASDLTKLQTSDKNTLVLMSSMQKRKSDSSSSGSSRKKSSARQVDSDAGEAIDPVVKRHTNIVAGALNPLIFLAGLGLRNGRVPLELLDPTHVNHAQCQSACVDAMGRIRTFPIDKRPCLMLVDPEDFYKCLGVVNAYMVPLTATLTKRTYGWALFPDFIAFANHTCGYSDQPVCRIYVSPSILSMEDLSDMGTDVRTEQGRFDHVRTIVKLDTFGVVNAGRQVYRNYDPTSAWRPSGTPLNQTPFGHEEFDCECRLCRNRKKHAPVNEKKEVDFDDWEILTRDIERVQRQPLHMVDVRALFRRVFQFLDTILHPHLATSSHEQQQYQTRQNDGSIEFLLFVLSSLNLMALMNAIEIPRTDFASPTTESSTTSSSSSTSSLGSSSMTDATSNTSTSLVVHTNPSMDTADDDDRRKKEAMAADNAKADAIREEVKILREQEKKHQEEEHGTQPFPTDRKDLTPAQEVFVRCHREYMYLMLEHPVTSKCVRELIAGTRIGFGCEAHYTMTVILFLTMSCVDQDENAKNFFRVSGRLAMSVDFYQARPILEPILATGTKFTSVVDSWECVLKKEWSLLPGDSRPVYKIYLQMFKMVGLTMLYMDMYEMIKLFPKLSTNTFMFLQYDESLEAFNKLSLEDTAAISPIPPTLDLDEPTETPNVPNDWSVFALPAEVVPVMFVRKDTDAGASVAKKKKAPKKKKKPAESTKNAF